MKLSIKNRNNVALSVKVEGEDNRRGLVFIAHGLGGFKEQVHIRAMAEAFLEAGYKVVSHDAANTIGESGGRVEDATLTSYFEDFEDVIAWSKGQSWYKAPFVLAGHSLGAACSLLYALKYPERVKAIAPISAFVSGKLYERALPPEVLKTWEDQGYMEEESASKPGVIKNISWGFIEDGRKYDLQELAAGIECPVLLVVGSKDTGTPVELQKQLMQKLSGPKELHVIDGSPHTMRQPQHVAELKRVVFEWITKLSNQ
jgi:pimeloyl-ACP methyl ester carboxylesterase